MNPSGDPGIYVEKAGDRFGRPRRVFGAMPLTVKVRAADTAGGMLVVEQTNDVRGGPPRHVHHEQEEWFYVLEGVYAIEVGARRHRLHAGDALLAPRGVPHGWARVGDGPGRMVIAFSPAGDMEAFFDAATALAALPPPDEVRALFAAHGMTALGPPIETD
jgi:quercetin dioxygenase-like cupin family protein